jgi:hypothetical protein
MRSRTPLLASALILILANLAATGAFAAGATVRDGGNLQLAGVTYRLDGIEAPAFDQMCIDEHADAWTCGAASRDQLAKLIGDRQVRCDDLGADPQKRHLGVCTVEVKPPASIVARPRRLCARRRQGQIQERGDIRERRQARPLERLLRGAAGFSPLEKGCHA